MKSKVTSKYEVYYKEELILVDDLKEAEKKKRSTNGNEFDNEYIIRKDYDENGNLIEEWLIG